MSTVFLKELKESLRQAGFVMAFTAVMPLVYLLDSLLYKTGVTFTEYMVGGYALLWFIAVVYLAYNMFRQEEMDNATEYLLSLPVSRWKLLIWKTTPRIAVILVIDLLLSLCTGMSHGIWFNNFSDMAVFLIFSQICGFVLGIIGRKSLITRLVLFVLMICAFIINSIPPRFMWRSYISVTRILPHPSALRIFIEQVSLSRLSYILLEFGFLALILLPLYRTWDLKPVGQRELPFAKRAIVPLIVLAFPVVYMFSVS